MYSFTTKEVSNYTNTEWMVQTKVCAEVSWNFIVDIWVYQNQDWPWLFKFYFGKLLMQPRSMWTKAESSESQ